MYNSKQVKAIANELKRRFMLGEIEGHEVVVTLLAMAKAGKIKSDDIVDILLVVFSKNMQGVLRSLSRASSLVDDTMIDEILSEVEHT